MKQLIETVNYAINEAMANMHTCTIAKVTVVNAKTINCKPVTNRTVDGKSVQLPEFIDVPVIVLHGGASSITMPISVGDYAVLMFTERCFDAWWAGNDFVSPVEYRMHDYSDGIAMVGITPGGFAIPGIITHVGDTDQTGDYTRTGNSTYNGDLTINGNLTVNGNITVTGGDLSVDGLSFKSHVHGGVQVGVDDTGAAK